MLTPSPSRSRRGLAALLCAGAVAGLTGCGWFGSNGPDVSVPTSVFDIKSGECFMAPSEVKAELSNLSRVPCTKPHTEEAYAAVRYHAPATSTVAFAGAYPGADALTNFANGACAQKFTDYVGVSYLDSNLFFTFLLPSARSWEQDNDRTVLCFVTQAGATRTASAKGSKQ